MIMIILCREGISPMARQSRHCQEIWEVIYLLILFDILKLGGVIACNTESATGSSDNWSGERRASFWIGGVHCGSA